MKTKKEDIPVAMEMGELVARLLPDQGGMDMSYNQFPKGTDFTPFLKGLDCDHCHCPHYGYIFEGKFRFIYDDGSEETYEEGDFYYAPAGHTAIVDEDVKFIDLSPHKEHQEVLSHVGKVIEQMNG
ncbi:hypothetical protein [Pelagicoccus mobilis]|uniref:Cupin domain-containing protein n=1 Tax=Pelagicoccus mobilis TaxID=415221 RepID=A0A934S1B7_9BACT|nr:hypothetical protein [Pelagicoccus mobilis]MBK1877629.1 hypothetical protein [Pelagicoccus mobilis]